MCWLYGDFAPTMTPVIRTSKTEFMRWLDLNPPTHDKRYNAIRCHNKHWGAYLRANWPDNFNRLYGDFWLAHPEKWPEAYPESKAETCV
jgi:hypothetical protein